MGLLSFMAKKPGDRNRSTALKSQAYSSTTAGAVPIRGTYPVAGNGPSAFETIAKSHPRLGRTQALKDKATQRIIWDAGQREVDVDDSSDLDYAPSPCISRYAKETTFDGRHSPGAGLRPGHGESDSVAVGVRRRWSLASDSPLASDNSNCWSSSTSRFRPQSRQTADTSVDSPYLVPPSLKTASSYGSLTSQGSNGAAVYQRKLNQFNIDDHVSTDEDSVYATRRPSPGKGEEDLLFPQDGFGMDGCSLPGGDGAPPSAADGDAVAAEDSDLESWHDALTDQEHASGRAPRLALSPSPSLSVRRGGQDDGVAAHDPKRPSALGTLYGHAYFGLGCVDGIVRQPGREPGRARMSQREEAFVIRARKEAKARRRAAERGEASAARRRSMMKVDSGSSK
ncbi:hypothetical protein P8C59_001476 [Phyllachora maydis]|uniref:Uncharacterized protein n=1 Tax=Phyllachora maydis TaxID=1825666 RepID=A0AAD9HYG6_9PEZI|nr:hypothetical protein P8C59_001476 [Phyllachora maydis]